MRHGARVFCFVVDASSKDSFFRLKKRKDGSPAQTKMQPRQDQKQLVMIQLETVQMNRRQPKQTDVIDESIVMDSGTARVSDEKAHQGVLRMDQEEGISAEEQARQRLKSKQPARQSLTDDEKQLKREATIAAIKRKIFTTVAVRPDSKPAHKFNASIRTLKPKSKQWRLASGEKELLQDGVNSEGTNVQ